MAFDNGTVRPSNRISPYPNSILIKQSRSFDRLQHAVGINHQGSRGMSRALFTATGSTKLTELALALLQRMASHVEAILGYLDCLLGHHRRLRRDGFPCRAIRLPDVSHPEIPYDGEGLG
jgi:hypothetical protein